MNGFIKFCVSRRREMKQKEDGFPVSVRSSTLMLVEEWRVMPPDEKAAWKACDDNDITDGYSGTLDVPSVRSSISECEEHTNKVLTN